MGKRTRVLPPELETLQPSVGTGLWSDPQVGPWDPVLTHPGVSSSGTTRIVSQAQLPHLPIELSLQSP